MPSFAEIDLGTLRVRDQMAIDARFGVDPRRWFAAAVAWHAAPSIRSDGERSFLCVDAAMHGTLHAHCTPTAGPGTAWGLITRHCNHRGSCCAALATVCG